MAKIDGLHMSAIDLLTLPFDQYQRYTIVVQVANLVKGYLNRSQLRVLDVGGYFRTRRDEHILPLIHFLPDDRVVAVDLEAEKLPNYALSGGQSLPFRDTSFDLVATCDTLEHVHPEHRPAFVDELVRVARHSVVLVAPFDNELTRLAERIFHEYLAAQGLHHAQLQEHIDNGLPDADAVRGMLAERNLAFLDFGDGYLHHWLQMMLIKYTPGFSLDLQLDLDRYYNQCFSPHDRREPSYRRAFVIATREASALLEDLPAALGLTNPAPAKSPSDFLAEFLRVLHWGQTVALAGTLRQTEERLAGAQSQLAAANAEIAHRHQAAEASTNLQARIAALEAENVHLQETVAGYERGRFIRVMRWLHEQHMHLQGGVHGR
jgi:SAM-dependent methyltransferase